MSEVTPAAPPREPFLGNTDPAIIAAKGKLLKLLQNPKSLEEFESVIKMTGSEFKISDAVLEFFENYLSFCHVFQSADFSQSAGFNPRLFPAQHPIYEKFKNGVSTESTHKKIPDVIVIQLLKFYSTFISTDASVKIPLLQNAVREKVAKRLVTLYDTKTESVDIFDDIAVLALENLFWHCYPQFLIYKGDAGTNRKILEYQLKWETSLETVDEVAAAMVGGTLEQRMLALQKISDEQEGVDDKTTIAWDEKKPLPKKIWDFIMSIFGISSSINFDSSKECLVATLIKPKMKKTFHASIKVFAKILSQGSPEERQLSCYESFSRLELKTKRGSDTRPLSLERFLKSIPSDPAQETRLVSPVMLPLFILFFQSFIAKGSASEIAISESDRTAISLTMSKLGKDGININIFDKAIDQVLETLYQGPFKKFVDSK